jgi:uroporphyrinogen decarboxylase
MESSDKPLLRALRGETTSPPPVWLMRQAGRYLPEYRALRERTGSFLDLCYAPERAAEATLQPIKRFGMDAAILFSDILLVPQALGQRLWFEPAGGPRLEPIRTRAEASILRIDGLAEHLDPVYRAARLVSGRLDDRTALIGFAGSPWTVATYMVEGGSSRDFAAVRTWAVEDPSGFDVLIDRLVEATSLHLVKQIEAGAEAVQLFDTWAGVVPETDFERMVIAPTRRVVQAIRHIHPRIPIIGFPRGIGSRYRRYFRETAVDALSIDGTISLAEAANLQAFGPIQGNLDPKVLVAGGPALVREVEAIISALAGGPFIFNLGHGVLPETPPEHVAQLIGLIRRS